MAGDEIKGATGSVRIWLRLEGLAVLVAALVAFAQTGASWWLAAALALAPDISFAAYLAGPRWGALGYNLAHSYLLAIAVALIAWFGGAGAVHAGALIWVAHIGADRLLGYGLKYTTGFSDTHLGRIGKS
ncbi:MAG: DUF4260 domain-containing protein [Rhodobiaceae bacterium]|nr:DUF4260 domain-containing protein [Rhodobiaceae bacterium]MCC0056370.1 DUF4260 domain-containing protein [Rhodobiaceae bacterium]